MATVDLQVTLVYQLLAWSPDDALTRYSEALNYLEIAISLDPNYKKRAPEDSDFDSLRKTYSFLFNEIVNGR